MDSEKPSARSLVSAWIWRGQLAAMPGWKAAALGLTRLALVLTRDLAHGQLTLRAMSLVYTTLLSLVPLLALSFSVLKAFGVYNQAEPVLRAFLAPLGASSAEVSRWILKFIDNLNVGVLGSIGLALLVYTVVSLLQKIEESLNFIWHVAELRSFALRFSGYLSVLLVGPVLLFAALGVTSTIGRTEQMRRLLAIEPLGGVAYAAGATLPVFFAIAAFTFVYFFVPNVKVRFGVALTGGTVAGALWQVAAWSFATFVVKSTQYAAIYSSLAIFVLFLLWLYLSWLILLLGASIEFYRQHPEYMIPQQGEPRLSNRMRERVALMAMYLIARAYRDGEAPWTFARLTQRLGVPMHALTAVLGAMQKGGLLVPTALDAPGFVPARELAAITVRQLLDTVRAAGEERFLGPEELPAPAGIESMLRLIDRAAGESVGNLALMDLVARDAQAQAAPPDPAPAPPANGANSR